MQPAPGNGEVGGAAVLTMLVGSLVLLDSIRAGVSAGPAASAWLLISRN